MKTIRIMLLALFMIGAAGVAQSQETAGNVLLLNSYHTGYLWTDEITQGVQLAFEGKNIELHVDYMDTKRQFSPAYQNLMAQILQLKHDKHGYDAVITSDDDAFDFVLRNRRQLFGSTPVIFCGVNYLRRERLRGIENVTGVNEQGDIQSNLGLIEKLHPDCRKIVVITDNTTTGKRIQEEVERIRAERDDSAPGLEMVHNVSVPELIAALRGMGKDTVVLYTFFFRDKNDQFLEYDVGVRLVEENAVVPVYGAWNFTFGFGIVGGFLVTGLDQGYEAGRKAIAVLNGVDADEIPIEFDTPTELRFDYRQLLEHDIPLSGIPENARIFFKPESFYEQNKKLIWMTVSVFGLLLTALLGIGYGFIRSRQAEREIRNFKKVIDVSSDAIGMSTPDGRHYYQNKVFDDLFGDIGDDPPGTIYADRQVGRAIFDTIMGGNEWIGEVAMHGKDKKVHDIFLRAYPVKKEGKIIALVGVHTDLTERKRSEADLRKMEKLKGVGTLAGGIAHDFNNILMGLFGNISLARSMLSADHPARGFLGEAEKSMNRATRLTKQLLTFSRGGDPVKEDASLGLLVEEVVCFDLSGSNVMPIFNIANDLWLAEVDKGQMQQVFSNLTINAAQAMSGGGNLYVTLENEEIEEPAAQPLTPGKYVKMTMEDEGTGIEPKHLDRVFDPYYSTKQTGSGLGLTTVYSVIKKHGGHIRVASEPGRGTTFTVYLPASDKARLPETATPEGTEPTTAPRNHVLVMDDEEMIRQVASDMLEAIGCTVQTAPDGEKALELYVQSMNSGNPFDLVIMDLTVRGGMGGKEAVEKLLAIDPGAKVIVSSGYASDPVLANHRKYGFRGIVSKPYDIGQLQEVLRRVLNA